MRQWLFDSLETFHDLSQSRRSLLQKTNGLAVLPLHERLWHGHLYWVVKFTKIETLSALRCTARVFIRRYCKIADRLFGGDRWQRYLEARRREVEHANAEIRRLHSLRDEREEHLFKSRLAWEAKHNASFVHPERHTIQ